jgi:hypothetical protein
MVIMAKEVKKAPVENKPIENNKPVEEWTWKPRAVEYVPRRQRAGSEKYDEMIKYVLNSKDDKIAFDLTNNKKARSLWAPLFNRVLKHNLNDANKIDLELCIVDNTIYISKVAKGTSKTKRIGKRNAKELK